MAETKKSIAAASTGSYESLFEHATLLEFSRVINASDDLRFILSHILLTIMGKMLSTKGMAILAHQEKKYRVEMVKGFSTVPEGTAVTVPRLPRSPFSVRKLATTRSPWAKFLRDAGASIILPMYIADRPVGLLAFGARMANKKLRRRELTYLASLANLSATAVEKSHRITELQVVNRKLDRKVQELNTLFDLGKEFGSMLDRDKLARLLVFSLLGQVGVNRYVICLKDRADMVVVASRIEGQPPQSEFLSSLARLKGPVRVPDIVVRGALDPRPTLTELGLTVAVPVHLKGESKGLILLGEKLSREPFSAGDMEFLSSLGNLAIIALENARLFQEAIEKQKMEDELMIAREIQKGLLPSVLPALPRIEIAAQNISSKQVGGDYYDVIPSEGGRAVIAIGDVSGKGTPAALLMANLQATIRALVPLNLPLAELTGRVNDLMCPNTGGNKFVTFFWAVLDPAAMTLTYVNAGHNYPYLLHADGSVDRLDKGGMILGVLKTIMPYEEATMVLRPADLLVLFTDGVSEAMSKESEEYGEERLEPLLKSLRGRPVGEIIERVGEDILRHTKGAPQSDDITMMVIQALPSPS